MAVIIAIIGVLKYNNYVCAFLLKKSHANGIPEAAEKASGNMSRCV